ncbi:hypothetical protein [Streptomyces adustus]|uniref:hypothetical protein n=1 Tax=Streptomyces adustus TaxID=1609272 RepID=UPI0037153530
MTESINRSLLRSPYPYGAVAVLAAVGVLVAYIAGAFEGPRGEIKADDVCLHVPDRSAAAETLNRVLPRSSTYDFYETWRPDQDWGFRSFCAVKGDGDETLFYLQSTVGPVKSPSKWVDDTLPYKSSGKPTYFNSGIKGVSLVNAAAIYVPCYRSEETSKARYNMTVLAHAVEPLEASEKEARKALIDLATSFARQAHQDAKCDLPSEIDK